MSFDLDIAVRRGDFAIDVAFQAGPGVTALFGPSGAGKTSVLDMIAGVLRPARGRIAVDGQVLFDAAKKIDLAPEQRRVGYIFQDGRLFPHLTVRQNLLYGYARTAPANRYVRPDQVTELLGVGALLKRWPLSLSGGEQQRVAIGRALLSSPRLMLMDEPLASLDAARKREILPYLARLRDELRIPILYVTHMPEEVRQLAAQVVVIRGGRVESVAPANSAHLPNL